MSQEWTVQPGTAVYGSDDKQVGKVDDIQDGYLVVHKGFFFPKDHYIPFSAINNHTEDRINLNVSAEEATNRDWDTVPTGTSSTTTDYASKTYDSAPLSTTTTDYDTTATTTTGTTGYGTTGVTGTTETYDNTATTARSAELNTDDRINVPVVEEELSATKRGVERGAVRVETNVTEREETLSVPVTEERVHVERRTVDRPADAADISAQGGVIDVPVYGEEVDMQKRARVVEEVEISKDAVQETRQVSGTVRREDVEVVDGTVTTDGTTTTTGTTATSTDTTRRDR